MKLTSKRPNHVPDHAQPLPHAADADRERGVRQAGASGGEAILPVTRTRDENPARGDRSQKTIVKNLATPLVVASEGDDTYEQPDARFIAA